MLFAPLATAQAAGMAAGTGSAVVGGAGAAGSLFGPYALFRGGMGLWSAFERKRAGKEAEKRFRRMAEEEERQIKFEQKEFQEESKDIARAGQLERGSRVADQAKGGTKVGTGSNVTQLEFARAKYDRIRERLSMRVAESQRRHMVRAREYRRAGKEARRGGEIGAFGDIAGAGFDIFQFGMYDRMAGQGYA